MDTEGPVSVLDRRPRASSRDRIIADRITRQRSPGPAFRHQRGRRVPSQSSDVGVEEVEQDVIYRISQPYRTSFSAKHSVTWGKPDRSRSLSPTSSLRSEVSVGSAPPIFHPGGGDKRRPRGRSKSPKRVTYNTRVTVRHSDTEDSMFTELSSHEYDDEDTPLRPIISPFSRSLISPRYNEFSQLSPVSSTLRTTPQRELRPKVRDLTNIGTASSSGDVSRDSGLDYSVELKDLSDQITKMQWSPKQNRTLRARPPPILMSRHGNKQTSSAPSSLAPSPPPGILKDSQNSRSGSNDPQTGIIRSGNGALNEDSPPLNTDIIGRDYEHERPFSYTNALKGDYGEDIQKLAKEGLLEAQQEQENHHGGGMENGGLTIGNGKTTPIEEETQHSPTGTSQGDDSPGRGSPVESGRLTPSKRSFSLSVTNFLKRVSPHFRRKRSKEKGSKNSSAESSAQSLAQSSDPEIDLESPTDPAGGKSKHSGRFSRNQVRQSFLKLVGRSSSRSKKKTKSQPPPEPIPTPSHYTIELQDPEKSGGSDEVDEIANGFIINSNENIGNGNGKSNFDATTNRIMKSIEQNRVAEQDIYRRFKDRHSPHGPNDVTTLDGLTVAPASITTSKVTSSYLTKPEPIRPYSHTASSPGDVTLTGDSIDARMEFFTESDIDAILRPHLAKAKQVSLESDDYYPEHINSSRVAPPSTLDVMPARTKRLLQTSVMSSISGDESIGDCSLDANLTASEPSLLGGNSHSGGSKQVVLPQSLVNSAEGRLPSETDSVKLRKPQLHKEGQSNKENNVPQIIPTTKSRSDPPSPVDPAHKPSYLKLSCAISGYGKYSRYSTYKDVNKRSPYSSQSSLRSDYSSPDPSMPAERRSGDESTPEHKNRLSPAGWSRTCAKNNGQPDSPTLTVNGHAPKYPTGDVAKDGEYFLQHTQFEEDRIRGLSLRAEAHMRSHDLPEEACGRIRAAIGKANLLITQKFGQFRELCQNHMTPSPDERETKWEDLQGFWDMVKIQIDNVDDMFAEIELMKHNGWQEVPKMPSRRSSASSSPKSGSLSQTSTPSATPAHTPGSKRKNLKGSSNKDTPESSPERTQKARQAAKARDEQRKKLLAERRAAMKQATSAASNGEPEVEIYLPEPNKK